MKRADEDLDQQEAGGDDEGRIVVKEDGVKGPGKWEVSVTLPVQGDGPASTEWSELALQPKGGRRAGDSARWPAEVGAQETAFSHGHIRLNVHRSAVRVAREVHLVWPCS